MKLTVREIVVFGMLGSLMYASKAVMEVLPNIHLLGALIVAVTVVYRFKALYPIYTYIFIDGLMAGFAVWWLPYTYIWTLLWDAAMLLPKKMPKALAPFVYAVTASLHGFLFGVLYAPAQALIYGLDFNGMLAWIALGFPFDIIHGVSNFICTLALACPIISLLGKERENGKRGNGRFL